jgi:hypothetical protein
MSDSINYGKLMHQAIRSVMVDVLRQVSETGLPGDHHFFITFETSHPGVDIPTMLKEQYPEEMTIVMQEWFDNLAVTEDRFSVSLNFSGQAQDIVIPFDAIKTFADPSVEFGLRFDGHEEEGDQDDPPPNDPPPNAPQPEGDVVSLDQFRRG